MSALIENKCRWATEDQLHNLLWEKKHVIDDKELDNFVIFVQNKYSVIEKPFALVINAKLLSASDLSNPFHSGIGIDSQNSILVEPQFDQFNQKEIIIFCILSIWSLPFIKPL